MNNIKYSEMPQNPQKAVIYLRVSTEEQVDNFSLETQEDICLKEAERRGMEVVQIFREEGRSARTIAGRPVLAEMMEFCRRHGREIDAVIIYKIDRISRQTADYLLIREKLARCGVNLISTSEPTGNSPAEKFIETMLASSAQLENEMRSERARNGMRTRFYKGLSNGVAPFGYLNNNGAIVDQERFSKVKIGWEMVMTEAHTYRSIAHGLTELGLRDRDGKPIRTQTLSRIFRNKFYAGKLVSKKYGLEVQGCHVPMVTEEEFNKVQAILDKRSHRVQPSAAKMRRDNPDFPLCRIVKCRACGTSFTGGLSKGKSQYYPYYFCNKHCSGTIIPRAIMHDLAEKIISAITLSPEVLNQLNTFLGANDQQNTINESSYAEIRLLKESGKSYYDIYDDLTVEYCQSAEVVVNSWFEEIFHKLSADEINRHQIELYLQYSIKYFCAVEVTALERFIKRRTTVNDWLRYEGKSVRFRNINDEHAEDPAVQEGSRTDRQRFCLDEKTANRIKQKRYQLKQIVSVYLGQVDQTENPDIYEAIKKIQRLNLAQMSGLLSPKIEAASYIDLKLGKPELGRDIIVTFGCMDTEPLRDEYKSKGMLERIIIDTLNNTNWRLMSNSIQYRLGYLNGRLRAYEKDDDLRCLIRRQFEANIKERRQTVELVLKKPNLRQAFNAYFENVTLGVEITSEKLKGQGRLLSLRSELHSDLRIIIPGSTNSNDVVAAFLKNFKPDCSQRKFVVYHGNSKAGK